MPFAPVSPKSSRAPSPPPPLAPIPGRRQSTAFENARARWMPAFEKEPVTSPCPPCNSLGILSRHVGISAPRMRSVSPLPMQGASLAPQRPTLRRAISSFTNAPAPSPLPPPPPDDLPSTLALESETLTRLVDESNAFVAALMIRVNSLHQATSAFKDNATFEQLSAMFASRPEFAGLDVARCVGLHLPCTLWKALMVSILEENSLRLANCTTDEQASGEDLLAGVLYWRARHESEALGLIRIAQRRTSSGSSDSTQPRSSIATTGSSTPSRKGSNGLEAILTKRSSGMGLEQHLPPTKE